MSGVRKTSPKPACDDVVALSVADLVDALGSSIEALLPVLALASARRRITLYKQAGVPMIVMLGPVAEELGLWRDASGRWSASSGPLDRVPARSVSRTERLASPWAFHAYADSRQPEPLQELAAGDPDPEGLSSLLGRLVARLGPSSEDPTSPPAIFPEDDAVPGVSEPPASSRAFDLGELRRSLRARAAAAVAPAVAVGPRHASGKAIGSAPAPKRKSPRASAQAGQR